MNNERTLISNKTYMFFVFVMSVLIVTVGNDVIERLAVYVTLLSSLWFIRRHQVMFATFLIAAVAWGASVNLSQRMGNVMPSDITLAILAISMLTAGRTNKLHLHQVLTRMSNIYLLLIAGAFLLLGIVKGYAVTNIFQDFKLFLYIYIPYLYLCSVPKEERLSELLMNVVQSYVCIIFLQELVAFRNVGLDNLVANGFGQRNVMIIVQFMPLAASILYVMRHRIGIGRLAVLQAMAFAGCLLSFTRTIWIAYLLALLIVILFENRKPGIIARNVVFTAVFTALIYYGLIKFFPQIYHQYFEAVVSRITDSTNSTNTLDHRMNSAGLVFKDKVYRLTSVFGSGFGEIWETKGAVFIENSFFYYVWKYGLVATVFFIFKLIGSTVQAVRSDALTRVIALNIFGFLCIGNFSGNLNLYYCAPILGFAFAYGTLHRAIASKPHNQLLRSGLLLPAAPEEKLISLP